MKKSGHEKSKKLIGAVLFIIYLICMCYILFFMDWRSRNTSGALRYNDVPLREIKRFIGLMRVYPYTALVNLLGNIIIFIPFGSLLTFFRRNESFIVARVTIISVTVSCTIELVQLFTRAGSCDVDDVILNAIGGFIGSLIYYIHFHRRKGK